MIKKISIISAIIVLLSINYIFAETHPVPFKKMTQPVGCSFFGSPLQVVSVSHTGKVFLNQETKKYVYGYKVVIRRPGKDDGRGVVSDGLNYKLEYWVAYDNWSPAIAIKNGVKIYQDDQGTNDKFITLFISTGLHPGTQRLRIAVFPYLMYSSTGSFRDAIQAYRSDYVSIIKRLVRDTTPSGFAAGVLWDKGEDVIVNSGLLWMSTQFGQIIEFEVPAIMPKITTRYDRDARETLKACSLVPNPDYNITDNTNDKRFHKRVSRQQFEVGQSLHAGTRVAYKFWVHDKKLRSQKEICGDGIDNNGNNQIDEGCYEKAILVDDNQCRDDTIGLIIDGRNYGVTPAGHKRHFNIGHLARGYHAMEIIAIKSGGKAYSCQNNDVVSYGVTLGKGMKFYSGGRQKSGEIHANGNNKTKVKKYSFYVP